MGSSRAAVRALAAAGVVAMVGASSPAQAATEYDGAATALEIRGLRLQLLDVPDLPREMDAVESALRDGRQELLSQLPGQLRSGAITVEDQVIGHAEYPGTDTKGELPPNPLLAATILEAKAVRTEGGEVLSESGIADLSIAGGVLSADLVKASCVGDGVQISPDVSLVQLSSTEHIIDGEITLRRGAPVRIDGLGTITFNQQQTDGATTASATNLVIDLDTDVSLKGLNAIFDRTASDLENATRQVVEDLATTKVGGRPLAPGVTEQLRDAQGQQVFEVLDTAVEEATTPARDNLPAGVRDSLNTLAHLSGTITIAQAECSQQVTDAPAPTPDQEGGASVNVDRADAPQTRLADTGAPVGILGAALAGVGALAGGGWALLRPRRR